MKREKIVEEILKNKRELVNVYVRTEVFVQTRDDEGNTFSIPLSRTDTHVDPAEFAIFKLPDLK